ncbi:MAG TPA: ribose-phosphate pyrophosphokinase [Kofleriaceae bacterium]|nr:ribose-phosphate pyrophosphokinase [Kofleriaceae bacterium]
MKPLILASPDDSSAARALADRLGADLGSATIRSFPDGELYVRIDCSVAGRAVWLVCTLHPASDKLLPLYFMAHTARDLGAASVYLAAPYLAYMRQDHRFQDGEGVTARYTGRLLSSAVDGLITVDPHLHRFAALDEVYSVPTRAVRAAPCIAEWVRGNVERPVLVGPDAESEQWVAAVAAQLGCPSLVLRKVRRGDREVAISPIDEAQRDRGRSIDWARHTPVLVDDIVSTARTMIETLAQLRRVGALEPICVGVHAVFSQSAYDDLRAAGAARVVTCNTIPHPSNAIDVMDLVAQAMAGFPHRS